MTEQNPKSTNSNFKIWGGELYLLFSRSNLCKYVEEEILKKLIYQK